jgi:hypothetical protein
MKGKEGGAVEVEALLGWSGADTTREVEGGDESVMREEEELVEREEVEEGRASETGFLPLFLFETANKRERIEKSEEKGKSRKRKNSKTNPLSEKEERRKRKKGKGAEGRGRRRRRK